MSQRVVADNGAVVLVMTPQEAAAVATLISNASRLVGDVIKHDAPHLAQYGDLNDWRFEHTLPSGHPMILHEIERTIRGR